MATETKVESAEGAVVEELDDFAALLKQEFRPRSDDAQSAVENAVATLAQQALSETTVLSDDAVTTIESMIAAIDEKLTKATNIIMHHKEFTKIEGAWRGLHHLVNNTETDEQLKVRVLNIEKKELTKAFKKFKGVKWDQNPLFKKIYGEEYDQLGGEPYGCLVGDYHFDHSAPDVEILEGMKQIAAAAHAPFITGTDPGVLQMESWIQLSDPRDLTKIMSTPEYAAWNALRESDDSKYLGLCLPRFLSRVPYGAKTDPVDEFDFEEDTSAGPSSYCWSNAAYAMAVNINKSFKNYGWCSRIRGVESGGEVTGLPVHTFPSDDGGVDMQCPTEVSIGDRREAELAKNGFMPMLHRKNTSSAAFIGAQSLQKPAEYSDPDATANAKLAARLPYLFATCRFAHYLKCMVRDKVGSFKEQDDMQKYLQKWITQYVDGDPTNSGEIIKAQKPLAEAEVVVEADPENPGMYKSQFFLRPHYQLEGLSVSLRLVSKLPSSK